MKSNEEINIGDTVSVNFNNTKQTLSKEAFVIHMPNATGDSWVFKDIATGAVHYVSEGCTITLMRTRGEIQGLNFALS